MNFEVNEALSPDERREKALAQFKDCLSHDSWVPNNAVSVEGDVANVPTLHGKSRKGIENANSFGFWVDMTFPGVDVETAWKIMSNITERRVYDKRLLDTEIFEENENVCYMYGKSKKPPVPLVSQRDYLVEFQKIRDGSGEGRHVLCSLNRVHNSKPIGTGFFDLVRAFIHVHGMQIEAIDPANPSAGVRLQELRSFDMNGNIPNAFAEGMLPEMMKTQFAAWTEIFGKAAKGEPLA